MFYNVLSSMMLTRRKEGSILKTYILWNNTCLIHDQSHCYCNYFAAEMSLEMKITLCLIRVAISKMIEAVFLK